MTCATTLAVTPHFAIRTGAAVQSLSSDEDPAEPDPAFARGITQSAVTEVVCRHFECGSEAVCPEIARSYLHGCGVQDLAELQMTMEEAFALRLCETDIPENYDSLQAWVDVLQRRSRCQQRLRLPLWKRLIVSLRHALRGRGWRWHLVPPVR